MDLFEEEEEDRRFIKLYKSSHFRGLDDEGILYGFPTPWCSNTPTWRQSALTFDFLDLTRRL
jgi:hypothetical protein